MISSLSYAQRKLDTYHKVTWIIDWL
uniref:Uncharacterized protein n=1 Tax=Rhizophora mucronata TaxID=61149 RepID=A0A2P2KR91_RHIMU